MLRNQRMLIDSVIKTIRLTSDDRHVIVVSRVRHSCLCLGINGNTRWIQDQDLRRSDDLKVSDINFWCNRLELYYNQNAPCR